MFKDQKEELRRLEAELLREEEEELQEAEEDWDTEEDWDGEDDWEEENDQPDVYAYNADHLDADLEEFSSQVYDSEHKARSRWTAAAALIVLATVLFVLAFLAARYMGR